MTWASPWAWALVAGLALPIAAHLWSRRQPRSVEFPTLRFLQATSPVSRRLRTIQDWPLLALRVLIVVVVAAAAAGPTVLSLTREHVAAALHRVIVVDEAVGGGASALVARLRGEALRATVLDAQPIASALGDAIAKAASSARRTRSEIVLVWDGTRPTLVPGDLASVPPFVGVRLEPIAATPPAPSSLVKAPSVIDGIELPHDAQALREPLLAALGNVRVPRHDGAVRLQWRSAGIDNNPALAPVSTARPRRALDDLATDPRLRDAAERSQTAAVDRNAAEPPRIAPLLDGRVVGDALVVESLAEPQAPLTWWAAVASAEAFVRWARAAATPVRWSPEELRAAAREPAAAEQEAAASGRHTRAAWLLVLGLLLVEQVWRSRLRRSGAGDAA